MTKEPSQPRAPRSRLLAFVWANKLFALLPLLLVLALLLFLVCDPLPEVVPPFIYR